MKKRTSWDRLENFLTSQRNQEQPNHIATSLQEIQFCALALTMHRDLLSAHRLSIHSIRLLGEDRYCM
ncbi:hypothetical protein [Brevibacillus sp. SYSU BS000544]|uniref:hypothetical protein n=1 Tax=Brevibacillus sp. SYSU BS000544 TaxID=3416443 RepID=UPI003CE57694